MENVVNLLKGLGQNFALALAFIYLAHFSRTFLRKHLHPILNQLIIGLFFGLVALVGMLSPIQLRPGLMIDGRIALTGLSSLIGGGFAGLATVALVGTYRYILGGAGRWLGIAGVITAALLGLVANRIIGDFPQGWKRRYLIGYGVLLAVGGLMWVFLLPIDVAWATLQTAAVPALIANAIEVLLIGSLVMAQMRRSEVEEELIASENRFRRALLDAPYPVMVHAEDGEIIMVNETWIESTGYSLEDIPTMSKWLEVAYGDRKGIIKGTISQLFTIDEKVNEGESAIMTRDHEERIWEFSSSPLGTMRDGRHIVLSIAVDVTERHATAELLEKRADHLMLLNTLGTQIVAMLDTHQLVAQATELIHNTFHYDHVAIFIRDETNDKMVQWARAGNLVDRFPEKHSLHEGKGIVGYVARSGEEFLVDDVTAEPHYFNPFDQDIIRSEWAMPIRDRDEVIGVLDIQSREESAFSESDLLTLRTLADQLSIAIHNARLFEGEQRKRSLAQSIQQVTERITQSDNLEEALTLLIEHLRQIVPHDRTAILVADHDQFKVAVATDETESDTIVDPAQLIALFSIAEPDKRLWIRSSNPLPKGHTPPPSYTPETTGWVGVPLIAGDVIIGYMCAASDSATGFKQEDVETIQLFASQASLAIGRSQILRDLHATQARLTRAARLATAGKVAAGVAHQINNPLAAIIAQIHLASQKAKDDAELQKRLSTIESAASHAAYVVQSMLDLGHTPSVDLTPLDINASLANALTMIRADIEPEIGEIVIELADDLPLIAGNQREMENVWLNLLTNARDALKGQDGGRIEIETSRSEPDQVEIRICDNGPGFSPDARAQVFEPFFTTKTHGTGLGLAICHDIIIQHQGTIELQSEVGAGACFVITLPVPVNPN